MNNNRIDCWENTIPTLPLLLESIRGTLTLRFPVVASVHPRRGTWPGFRCRETFLPSGIPSTRGHGALAVGALHFVIGGLQMVIIFRDRKTAGRPGGPFAGRMESGVAAANRFAAPEVTSLGGAKLDPSQGYAGLFFRVHEVRRAPSQTQAAVVAKVVFRRQGRGRNQGSRADGCSQDNGCALFPGQKVAGQGDMTGSGAHRQVTVGEVRIIPVRSKTGGGLRQRFPENVSAATGTDGNPFWVRKSNSLTIRLNFSPRPSLPFCCYRYRYPSVSSTNGLWCAGGYPAG